MEQSYFFQPIQYVSSGEFSVSSMSDRYPPHSPGGFHTSVTSSTSGVLRPHGGYGGTPYEPHHSPDPNQSWSWGLQGSWNTFREEHALTAQVWSVGVKALLSYYIVAYGDILQKVAAPFEVVIDWRELFEVYGTLAKGSSGGGGGGGGRRLSSGGSGHGEGEFPHSSSFESPREREEEGGGGTSGTGPGATGESPFSLHHWVLHSGEWSGVGRRGSPLGAEAPFGGAGMNGIPRHDALQGSFPIRAGSSIRGGGGSAGNAWPTLLGVLQDVVEAYYHRLCRFMEYLRDEPHPMRSRGGGGGDVVGVGGGESSEHPRSERVEVRDGGKRGTGKDDKTTLGRPRREYQDSLCAFLSQYVRWISVGFSVLAPDQRLGMGKGFAALTPSITGGVMRDVLLCRWKREDHGTSTFSTFHSFSKDLGRGTGGGSTVSSPLLTSGGTGTARTTMMGGGMPMGGVAAPSSPPPPTPAPISIGKARASHLAGGGGRGGGEPSHTPPPFSSYGYSISFSPAFIPAVSGEGGGGGDGATGCRRGRGGIGGTIGSGEHSSVASTDELHLHFLWGCVAVIPAAPDLGKWCKAFLAKGLEQGSLELVKDKVPKPVKDLFDFMKKKPHKLRHRGSGISGDGRPQGSRERGRKVYGTRGVLFVAPHRHRHLCRGRKGGHGAEKNEVHHYHQPHDHGNKEQEDGETLGERRRRRLTSQERESEDLESTSSSRSASTTSSDRSTSSSMSGSAVTTRASSSASSSSTSSTSGRRHPKGGGGRRGNGKKERDGLGHFGDSVAMIRRDEVSRIPFSQVRNTVYDYQGDDARLKITLEDITTALQSLRASVPHMSMYLHDAMHILMVNLHQLRVMFVRYTKTESNWLLEGKKPWDRAAALHSTHAAGTEAPPHRFSPLLHVAPPLRAGRVSYTLSLRRAVALLKEYCEYENSSRRVERVCRMYCRVHRLNKLIAFSETQPFAVLLWHFCAVEQYLRTDGKPHARFTEGAARPSSSSGTLAQPTWTTRPPRSSSSPPPPPPPLQKKQQPWELGWDPPHPPGRGEEKEPKDPTTTLTSPIAAEKRTAEGKQMSFLRVDRSERRRHAEDPCPLPSHSTTAGTTGTAGATDDTTPASGFSSTPGGEESGMGSVDGISPLPSPRPQHSRGSWLPSFSTSPMAPPGATPRRRASSLWRQDTTVLVVEEKPEKTMCSCCRWMSGGGGRGAEREEDITAGVWAIRRERGSTAGQGQEGSVSREEAFRNHGEHEKDPSKRETMTIMEKKKKKKRGEEELADHPRRAQGTASASSRSALHLHVDPLSPVVPFPPSERDARGPFATDPLAFHPARQMPSFPDFKGMEPYEEEFPGASSGSSTIIPVEEETKGHLPSLVRTKVDAPQPHHHDTKSTSKKISSNVPPKEEGGGKKTRHSSSTEIEKQKAGAPPGGTSKQRVEWELEKKGKEGWEKDHQQDGQPSTEGVYSLFPPAVEEEHERGFHPAFTQRREDDDDAAHHDQHKEEKGVSHRRRMASEGKKKKGKKISAGETEEEHAAFRNDFATHGICMSMEKLEALQALYKECIRPMTRVTKEYRIFNFPIIADIALNLLLPMEVVEARRARRVGLLFGLDRTGKTLISNCLRGLAQPTVATVGMQEQIVSFGRWILVMNELGGRGCFRRNWQYYVERAPPMTYLIFLIDAQNRARMKESRAYLWEVLDHIPRIPLLIIFNNFPEVATTHGKGAVSKPQEVLERGFGVPKIREERWMLVVTCDVTLVHDTNRCIPASLQYGFEQLTDFLLSTTSPHEVPSMPKGNGGATVE